VTRTRRFLGGVGVGWASQAIMLVVGLWTTRFFLERLGQSSYGLWLVATQVLGYLGLADLGVLALLPRETAYASAHAAEGSHAATAVLLGRTFRLLLWQTALVAALAAGVWLIFPASWEPLRGPIGVLLIGFVLLFPARILPAAVQGLQDLAFVGALQLAAWGTGTALTVLLTFQGRGLVSLAIGWIATQLVMAVGCAARLLRRFPTAVPRTLPALPPGFARSFLTRGSWMNLNQVAQVLLTGTDLLIIGRQVGPAAVVTYSVTGKLPMVFQGASQTLPAAAVPALSELKAQDDRPALLRVNGALMQAVFLVSGATAVVVLAANASFVGWWVGANRFGGALLTAAILASMLLHHANMCLGYALFAMGHERRLTLTALADGVATVALSLVLVRAIGPVGAPLGAIAGVCLISLPFNLDALARATGTPFGSLFRPLVPWVWRMAIVVPAATLAGMTWVGGHFLVAATTASAGAAAYVLLMGPYALRDPLGEYTRKYGRALLARVRGA
jgi:O-antigen/teichoic acid export membrane protein